MKSRKTLLEGLLKANDITTDIEKYLKHMGEMCPRTMDKIINIKQACVYLYEEIEDIINEEEE